MQTLSRSKGFTLIELLVVIAILGILAAVVLIAINPGERINEANDTKVRSDISLVASAVEACFTSEADGTYNNCDTVAELVSASHLKTAPATTPTFISVGTGANIGAYAEVKAASARPSGCATGTAAFYVYRTTDGKSGVTCGAPTAANLATVTLN